MAGPYEILKLPKGSLLNLSFISFITARTLSVQHAFLFRYLFRAFKRAVFHYFQMFLLENVGRRERTFGQVLHDALELPS